MENNKFYTVGWASPPSESEDQHGNRWQTLSLEGHDGFKVQILAKVPIEKGARIYGSVTSENKKSGGTYYRLRRKTVPEGVSDSVQPPTQPTQQTSGALEAKVDEILSIVKQLAGIDASPKQEPPKETVLEDINDDPVDLSDIPF